MSRVQQISVMVMYHLRRVVEIQKGHIEMMPKQLPVFVAEISSIKKLG